MEPGEGTINIKYLNFLISDEDILSIGNYILVKLFIVQAHRLEIVVASQEILISNFNNFHL